MVFGATFLSLSQTIIQVSTKANIRWFLYKNSFYNNCTAMNLDLKSKKIRKFKENLKIGARLSLVPNV